MWYTKSMTQHTSPTYLCDVAVFAHIPLTREQFFWYTSDVPLPPGTLVRVPLFRRTVRGVVLACHSDHTRAGGNIKLKRIAAVLHNNYFTPTQIALATHIATTTFTSLGTVLSQFYVPPTAARAGTHDTAPSQRARKRPALTATTRTVCADVLARTGTYASFLLRDTPATARDALFTHLIARLHATDATAQVLILLPEILITAQTVAFVRAHFPTQHISVIHNKLAKGALWRAYSDIASGTAQIIIGTRKALFAPFANLALVIVDEEHDMSFKQWERAPRFDARAVADTLARMHSCPLVAVSAAPHITRTVPRPLAAAPLSPPITLVDMRAVHFERVKEATAKKRKKPPVTLFSPILLDAMRTALAHRHQVLLFFNHKGMSAFSLCTDCGTLLACPDCDRALVLATEGHYECFHCTYTTSIFPTCAQCNGMTFRNVGYGTGKIENMCAKLFPRARIIRIDGHSMRGTHAAREVIAQANDADIIIGTQMALKDWRNPRLRVVGILDADALLSIPDISADERLFAFIANAAAAVTHARRSPGTVLVQTYKPDYHLFADAARLAYDRFRKRVLAERRTLHYPPYWRVIKLIFQHKDADKVATLAQEWHAKITDLAVAHTPWLISAPHAPLLPKLRGLHRCQILIRITNPTRTVAPIPETLATLLSATPPRTIIDIDPVSLV